MIKIICVGKVKERYLRDGIEDYTKRISKYHKISIIELEDSNMKEEANKILKCIDDKSFVITLEINGKEMNSLEFSALIDKTFISNSNICFVIGGSDGLDDTVKERSNFSLSFSKFTFPHQLFRLVFLEQLYRAFKIMCNETYHK